MPAWTPDSRALVFSSTRSGNLNLWEIQLGSQTPTQVTFGPGMDFAPAVARNGSIAFGQFDHEIDIYRVNLESRNLEEDPGERLTTFTGENFGPRISRNGTILYHSNRADPTNADVWMIDESGAHQNLTDHSAVDRLADWSADGKEIVFMSDREDAVRLWVLEVATGKTRRLTPREQHLTPATHSAEAEGGPRWSPDNKLIAYLAPAAEGSTIWVVGTEDGSNPQATNIRGATSFAWYKDSKRLIYTRQPRGGSAQELIATNLETGEEQVLRKGAIAEIAVSADGNWLSFMNSVSHFTMDLFVMSLGPAGSNGLPRAGAEKQVTFGKGVWHAHAGGFSADGKSLVYSRDRDFGNIHVMEKNTQK
jgi:Tol biopolymer transport system component